MPESVGARNSGSPACRRCSNPNIPPIHTNQHLKTCATSSTYVFWVSPDWWFFTPRITLKCLRGSRESRIMTLYFVLIAVCVLCAVAYRIHLTKVRRQAARSKAQAELDKFARQNATFAAVQLSTPRARHRPPTSPRPVGMSRAHAAPYTGTPSPAPSDDLLTAAVLYSAFSTPSPSPGPASSPSYSGGGDFSGAGASGSWDSSSSSDSGSSCSASSSD